MSDTPKAAKSRGRSSLSLNKRLTKRLSSPQNRKANTDNSNMQVISLDDNDGTPPHKKLNLDESYDSPTTYDSNHSPTMFLSQTFCPDSPEVSWQWTKEMEYRTKIGSSNAPDSGISSYASSSTSVVTVKRSQRQSCSSTNKQELKLRTKLSEQQRADKIRSEAILRERLSKLEDQLKIASSNKPMHTPVEKVTTSNKPVDSAILPRVTAESDTMDMENFSDFDNIFDESLTLDTTIKFDKPAAKPAVSECNDMDDFFNDTDSDSFLLAATQQIESALPKAGQAKVSASMPANVTTKAAENDSMTTPNSSKNKRSSLYMKFLEDDEDDLFVSLDDETVLKASQSLKTRSPFQRYKSMPAATTSPSTSAPNSKVLTSSGTKVSEYPSWSLRNGTQRAVNPINGAVSNKPPIKRHASSHALQAAQTNLHGLQLKKRY